jgi:D-alanyl-D-alanine carboxypeptidase/D-alanyl-D-alanine-endopeptidase (penicillin-binding protein 4)
LEVLGSNFRFKTRVEYVGNIDSATSELNGYIIIKGSGDPTLGSKYFNNGNQNKFMNDWINAIKIKGISSVNGKLVGDSRVFCYDIVPPSWAWEDMGNYFGAGPNGLSVFDNMYTITYKTGTNVGDKCEILSVSPEIDGLVIDNQVKASDTNSDNSYIFGAPYSNFRYIRGELPKGKDSYEIKGSIPDPAIFLVSEFSKQLKIFGINFSEGFTTYRENPELAEIDSLKHELLYETVSPYLTTIIKETNFRSLNLYAETLLCQIGLSGIKNSSTKEASSYMENFWKSKGMDVGGMSLNDGSGLSRYNTVTAKQMVFMLKYMKTKSKNFDSFYESMPVAGVNGTVKSLCLNSFAENNMHLKSGSIRYVAAYAGYVKTKSGRETAFFIDMNNYNCTSSEARKKLEKVLIALAEVNF